MSDEANKPNDTDDTEVYVTAGVISSGPETGAIVSVGKIKARDLTADHVGKFVTGYDPSVGANVHAKILKVRHVNEGKAPGVSVLVRVAALPDGTPDRDEPRHVPFDHEFELASRNDRVLTAQRPMSETPLPTARPTFVCLLAEATTYCCRYSATVSAPSSTTGQP